MMAGLADQLLEASKQRTHGELGAEPNTTRIFPNTAADVSPSMPVFYQESYDY